MRYFVGLDWGSTTHAVCVLEAEGREVSRFMIAHTAEGLAELCRRLAGLAPAAEVPVAIERPSGLLVDTLIEAGHPVVPIHPNAVKAARPRYCSSGAKSDGADAHLLADLLRTDGHRFAPLRPQSDEIRALRTLVRSRDDLVATRVRSPTSSAPCSAASGRARPPSSPTSTARSRSPFSAASRRRPAPPSWVRGA